MLEHIDKGVLQLGESRPDDVLNVLDILHLLLGHQAEEIAGLVLVHIAPALEQVIEPVDIISRDSHGVDVVIGQARLCVLHNQFLQEQDDRITGCLLSQILPLVNAEVALILVGLGQILVDSKDCGRNYGIREVDFVPEVAEEHIADEVVDGQLPELLACRGAGVIKPDLVDLVVLAHQDVDCGGIVAHDIDREDHI